LLKNVPLQLIIHKTVKQKKQGLKNICCGPVSPKFLSYNTKDVNNLLLRNSKSIIIKAFGCIKYFANLVKSSNIESFEAPFNDSHLLHTDVQIRIGLSSQTGRGRE